MTFALPWIFAIGMIAAAAPVIVHWLTRPRPVRMPLSTLRFVREAVRQRRATHRLRDWLILVLRTLAILLLAAAFAGPQWGERSLMDEDADDAVRVVVLDVSQSMAAADGNTPAIERARSIADRYLQFRSGLRSNLVLAGATPWAVFDNPSTNFEALREELSRAKALPQRTDVKGALELAARLLAPADENDQRRRELVIVSDFQRSGWGVAAFDGFSADTKIQMESVAPAEPPANLAIIRASCRPLGARQDRLQLEVVVGNFTSTGRKVTVEAELGGSVHRLSAACPPQEETTLSEELPARTAGWLWGEVRLVDAEDALAADNHRPLVVELRGEPSYALVTQQPVHLRPSSSHILSCALAPELEPDSPSEKLLRIDPATLDNQSLAQTDLITVNRCGKLSSDHIGLLARQLQRGRPILYVASEAIDAANIDLLAKEAGIDLPVRFAPPPAGTFRSELKITTVNRNRPPFSAFGDSLPAVLGGLRFAGGLSADNRTAGSASLGENVLGIFNDGTAALVVARGDGGALTILNADLAASNIWKTGALVPVIDELVQLLLSTDAGDDVFYCGEPLVARLSATNAADDLHVARGREEHRDETFGQLTDDGAGALWQWPAPSSPDVYRIASDDETVYAAAVAIPAEEADLASLPADVVLERLAAGRDGVHFRSRAEGGDGQHDLWTWFAVAVVICFLAEFGVLLAFKT